MKIKPILLAVVSAALAAPAALADTETHKVNYTYSLAVNGDIYPRLRFPGFDDQGGTRTLERVDLRVQAEIAATIAIENMTNAPLSGWSLDGQHIVLAGLEREDPQQFGPFAFMGGLFIDPITATLQANDGTPRSGPDYLATALSTPINSLIDMDPSYLDFFGGGGEIVATVGPFTEFFLQDATVWNPDTNEGDALVEFVDLSQAGEFSLIYTYSTVPEPATALGLAAAGLLVAVRRRRA